MLIGQSKDEAMRWLATQMGLPPCPSKWPIEWMERLLLEADSVAKRFIEQTIYCAQSAASDESTFSGPL